jgi:hypothetical protein
MHATISTRDGKTLSYDSFSLNVTLETGPIQLWHIDEDGIISTVVRDKMFLDLGNMLLSRAPVQSDLTDWIIDLFETNEDELENVPIDPSVMCGSTTYYDDETGKCESIESAMAITLPSCVPTKVLTAKWGYDMDVSMMPCSTADFYPMDAQDLTNFGIKYNFSDKFRVGIDPLSGWIQVRSRDAGKLKLKVFAFTPNGEKVKTKLKVVSTYLASGEDLVFDNGDVVITEQSKYPYIFVKSPWTRHRPSELMVEGFDDSELTLTRVLRSAYQATSQAVGVYDITFTANFARAPNPPELASATMTYIVVPSGSMSPEKADVGYTENDQTFAEDQLVERSPMIIFAPYTLFFSNDLSNGLLLNRYTGEVSGRAIKGVDHHNYIVAVGPDNSLITLVLTTRLTVIKEPDATASSGVTLTEVAKKTLYSEKEIDGFMP